MSRSEKYLFLCLAALLVLSLGSCSDPVVPKPKAMLRLEYPEPEYSDANITCPFDFQKNTSAKISGMDDCSFVLEYPEWNASVYVTYKPVNSDLDKLLRDAQKLTYEHVVKADNITEQPFVNTEGKVFGMFYELEGNAASQSQFYLTDSLKHFVTGSLYFKAKPNYDSVMPAARYLSADMRKIMESFHWK